MNGTLYIAATPIGNLSDISFRFLETLRNTDFIYSETPRKIKNILYKHEIKNKPIRRLREFESERKSREIIKLLKDNKTVVFVSDSGTPGIQDPGSVLVKNVLDDNLTVSPIPGPSALTAAISVCGFRCDRFFFEGFLPKRTGKKKKRLESLSHLDVPIILYESPHKILETTEMLDLIFKTRNIFIAREISKIYEQFVIGSISEILQSMKNKTIPVRGEFTLIIEGRKNEKKQN